MPIPKNSVVVYPKAPMCKKINVLGHGVIPGGNKKSLGYSVHQDNKTGQVTAYLSILTKNDSGKDVKCAKVTIPTEELWAPNGEGTVKYEPLNVFTKNMIAHFGDNTPSVVRRLASVLAPIEYLV